MKNKTKEDVEIIITGDKLKKIEGVIISEDLNNEIYSSYCISGLNEEDITENLIEEVKQKTLQRHQENLDLNVKNFYTYAKKWDEMTLEEKVEWLGIKTGIKEINDRIHSGKYLVKDSEGKVVNVKK